MLVEKLGDRKGIFQTCDELLMIFKECAKSITDKRGRFQTELVIDFVLANRMEAYLKLIEYNSVNV